MREEIFIVQRSPEWYAYRKEMLGASALGFAHPDRWDDKAVALADQLKGSDIKLSNTAMKHGIKFEDAALSAFNLSHGMAYKPTIFKYRPLYRRFHYPLSASLDGYSKEQNSLLEIKCPLKGEKSQLWELAVKGHIPEYYLWQIKQQLVASGAEQAYFYVYAAETGAGVTIEVASEKSMEQEVLQRWHKFLVLFGLDELYLS